MTVHEKLDVLIENTTGGGNLNDVITIGNYNTDSSRQIDCTHIPNYNVLSIDNFIYTNVSLRRVDYLNIGVGINNADSYNSDTGIYTIGQKTDHVYAQGNPQSVSHSINFTLKCIPYVKK